MFFQNKKIEPTTNIEEIAENSPLLLKLNEYYKNFLLHYSCFVYMLAVLMIVCSIMYYISYWKQCYHMRRRNQSLRRTNQRITPPHRPYAIYREHEVFRKIMLTVRKYQELVGDRKQIKIQFHW